MHAKLLPTSDLLELIDKQLDRLWREPEACTNEPVTASLDRLNDRLQDCKAQLAVTSYLLESTEKPVSREVNPDCYGSEGRGER